MAGRNWPGPGFPGDRRKLTMPGRAIAPKVRFVAPARTHTDGHQQSLVNGGLSEPDLPTGKARTLPKFYFATIPQWSTGRAICMLLRLARPKPHIPFLELTYATLSPVTRMRSLRNLGQPLPRSVPHRPTCASDKAGGVAGADTDCAPASITRPMVSRPMRPVRASRWAIVMG